MPVFNVYVCAGVEVWMFEQELILEADILVANNFTL